MRIHGAAKVVAGQIAEWKHRAIHFMRPAERARTRKAGDPSMSQRPTSLTTTSIPLTD